MALEIEQIKTELQKMASRFGPSVIIPAAIVSVNKDEDTVHVCFSDDAEIEDVRLKSIVKAGSRVVLYPKVGSIVQVARIENSEEYLVIAVDEITEAVYVIDGVKFSFDNQGFLLKKGTETLKKLMDDLFAAIGKMVFTTPVGPTINLVNLTEFQALQQRFDNFLKDN